MIGDPIRTEEPNAITNRKSDCYSQMALRARRNDDPDERIVAFDLRLRLHAGGSGGSAQMRILGIVALCAALGGCAASRQEVAVRLGDQYIGQNVCPARVCACLRMVKGFPQISAKNQGLSVPTRENESASRA